MMQDVVFSTQIAQSLSQAVARCGHDRLFVLTDTVTLQACWPLVADLPCMRGAQMITIGATDEHKTIESLMQVWTALQQQGATRHSLMVNLGG
ncbi:MAG: 3-dehydroquinate synthase, partial [Prevotellaceae bacterium]|nr:3-dehydroquinate synthase [Prevotellaceae bacterium]